MRLHQLVKSNLMSEIGRVRGYSREIEVIDVANTLIRILNECQKHFELEKIYKRWASRAHG